jgi:hypothetical protein
MLFFDRAEELLRKRVGWDVPLVDEEAFTLESSPFATARTMCGYIAGLLDMGPDKI